MTEPSLLQRLKERKLVQWALAYLAGAWVVFEGTGTAFETWNVPVVLVRSIHVLLIVGFFISLVLAWFHGEKGRQRVSGPELLMMAALLVLAGVALSSLGPEGPDQGVEGLGPQSTRLSPDPRPGIAALPWVNRSGTEADAWFVDAIHDEVLTRLANIGGLRVIGRQSVERFRGSDKPAREIARELDVRFVVEAGMFRAGDSVRIHAQLIDAETEGHLWAEGYTRSLAEGNLIEVQIDLALRIADALGATLNAQEEGRVGAIPTRNEDAYQYYLRGRAFESRPAGRPETRQDLETAEQLYRQAIAMDPAFALARARLAIVLSFLSGRSSMVEQLSLIQEALRLEPDLPDGRVAMGWVYFDQREFGRALEEFETALQGRPNDVEILWWLGDTSARFGQPARGLDYLEAASTLNPRYADAFHQLGRRYRQLHRYEEARGALNRALTLEPDLSAASRQLGLLYLQWKGETDTLRAMVERFPSIGMDTQLKLRLWEDDAEGVFSLLGTGPDGIVGSGLTRSLFSAWAHQRKGDQVAARAAFDSARAYLEPRAAGNRGNLWLQTGLGFAFAGLGRTSDAVRSVQYGLEASRLDAIQHLSGRERGAQILAQAGLVDEAIELLEPLLAGPSFTSVKSVQVEFVYDPIRGHPRFQALLERYADDG